MTSKRQVIDLIESDGDGNRSASQATGKRSRETDESNGVGRACCRKSECKDKESLALPVPFMVDSENITVTEDLLPLLNVLELASTRTCSRSQEKSSERVNLSFLHIQQNDKWSCGYRNLQMMLSSLLPRFQMDHPYFDGLPESLRPSKESRPIPSLKDIQGFLEHAWQLGFDPRGQEFYSGTIIGKVEWVGAVEVWSILASRNIDAVVVQFMKSQESRLKLGKFVWDYFSKAVGGGCAGSKESCRNYARRLLNSRILTEHFNQSCTCPVPPLYLQWKGHSVTIIGVRELLDSSYDLILFYPAKAGGVMKEGLCVLLDKKSASFPTCLTKNSKTLLEKDVQILMTSFCGAVDCSDLRNKLNVITAV